MITTTNNNEVVNNKYLSDGNWEVEINGKKYPCSCKLNPMYDPKNLKIKS
jgi:hypothetical protein